MMSETNHPADTDTLTTAERETIHANIAEKNGRIQGACGINPGRGTISGHSFVYHRSFDAYRCDEREAKCRKCENALTRLTRH